MAKKHLLSMLFLIMTACTGPVTIDGSSDHSFQSSVMKIASEMDKTTREKFFLSLDLIILNKSGITFNKDLPGLEAKTFLHEKSHIFIIELGEKLKAEITKIERDERLLELVKQYDSIFIMFETEQELEEARKKAGPDAAIQTSTYKRDFYDIPASQRVPIYRELVNDLGETETNRLIKLWRDFEVTIGVLTGYKNEKDSTLYSIYLESFIPEREEEIKEIVKELNLILPNLPGSTIEKNIKQQIVLANELERRSLERGW